jgi:hypothetical protein
LRETPKYLIYSLFYKISLLDQNWIGLEHNNLFGILIFEIFPGINDNSDQIQPMELNIIIINKLLHTSSITEHLDNSNKEYYLQLQSNTKYFLILVENQPFLSFGFYYDNYISTIVIPSNVIIFIDTDLIQQYFLQFRVVEENISLMVFTDINCGNWNFTLT